MQQRMWRLVGLITTSKRFITAAAIGTLIVVGVLKFSVVRSLLSMGVPREVLQAQDAILSGALSAVLVWLLLMAVRVRRRQEEEQIRVVADLNHNLRNALEIIFDSEYLRQSDRATAILEGVQRIDRTLNILLPAAKKPRSRQSE